MKFRTAVIVLAGVLGLAGAAVYVRRKRAAAAPPPVQLGLEGGGERSLAAGDPGVAELQSAAAAVRRGFEIGA
ncbi:MAG: hypothetical protein IMZ74_16140 [Actinobacteria bacterium]|nr:hypothetical protein [Actinomycetota bacterium]